MDRYELPQGWVLTTVGDLFEVVGGGTPSTAVPEYWNGEIPWITSADIHGLTEIRPRKTVTPQGIENSATNLVPKGSLIVVTRVGLGKIARADTPLCFSQDSQGLIDYSYQLNPKYALYYLSQVVQIFKYSNRGTTISGVTKKQLKELEFVLPPLPEQQRIVDEIEVQFTRLDAVVAALKRAQATLKRYRASVLKTACEGRLVPQNPTDEPASQLLERILTERRQQWNGRGPYTEPDPPDYKGLSIVPDLPENWTWASIDQITRNFDGIRVPVRKSDRAEVQGEYPYYGATGIIDSVNDFLFDGNYLLIAEDGKNLIYRNKPIAFQAHGKFWVNNHAHIVQTLSGCPLGFLENYLNSIDVTFYTTGIDQIKLNQANMNKIPVPLPPLAEQQRIVEEVERRLSVMDEVEATLEANLKRAERLRQSILKRAFEGKLVPQNPADEPASVLLGRIREAKAKAEGSRQMGLPGV